MIDLHVTSALPGAKRRARRRSASAGGTMFVVAMTLAVLSTIGAWALQSAALEVRMAGYERQSMQTHYLAEYGVLAAIQDVPAGNDGWSLLEAALNGSGGYHDTCTTVPCISFPAGVGSVTVMAGTGCSEIQMPLKNPAKGCKTWVSTSQLGVFPPPTAAANLLDVTDAGVSGAPGSLGATSTTGSIRVELTDITDAPKPTGFSSLNSYWIAVTAFGQTSTGSTSSQGTEQLRTRLMVGAINPL